MRKGLRKGKFNPLLLRIAQRGGNDKPRESSPLSGVGVLSGLGPGLFLRRFLNGLCSVVEGIVLLEEVTFIMKYSCHKKVALDLQHCLGG